MDAIFELYLELMQVVEDIWVVSEKSIQLRIEPSTIAVNKAWLFDVHVVPYWVSHTVHIEKVLRRKCDAVNARVQILIDVTVHFKI